MSRRHTNLKFSRESVPQHQLGGPPTPMAVLREVFDLLEEYAPMWYTEEMHDRALSVLSEHSDAD